MSKTEITVPSTGKAVNALEAIWSLAIIISELA